MIKSAASTIKIGGHAQSDGTRTVTYGYDTAGNLTSFKDANLAATSYTYASPGMMWQVFPPEHSTTALVANTYDTLGRVQTQANGNGGVTNFYFAGSRTEEVTPTGGSKVSYLDPQGHVLSATNPLGKTTVSTYDTLGRLVSTTLPEGNQTQKVLLQ